MMRLWLLMAAVLGLMLSGPTAQAGLGVGDLAPPLAIAEWVQGKPVDLSKDAAGKLHLVEFWAVWCPPCKQSIPKLTQVQKRFKDDLVIIGVTTPDNRGNSAPQIRRFTSSQGAKMGYTVAIDKGESTYTSYMTAARVMGIPHAFLVGKDRRILWQGSPLDPIMNQVIQKAIAGTYDIKAAKNKARAEQMLQALDPAVRRGQWRVVWDGLVDVLNLDPTNELANKLLMRICVDQLRNQQEYRQWADAHIEKNKTNLTAMLILTKVLCENGDPMTKMPGVALKAAKTAYHSSTRRQAGSAAAYARAMYQIGALDRAITLQEEAVSLAQGRVKQAADKELKFYVQCKRLQADFR